MDGVGVFVILHLEWGQVHGETSATGMFGQSDTGEETLPALSQQELLVSDWGKNDPDADDAPVSPLSTDVDGPMVKPTHTLKL